MADFYKIKVTDRKINKWETIRTIQPSFQIVQSKDLMVRAGDFYAFWDDKLKRWNTSEYDLIDRIDEEVWARYEKEQQKVNEMTSDGSITLVPLIMKDASSGKIDDFHRLVKQQMRENYRQLDSRVIFANVEELKREDYATKTLSYRIGEGDISGYDMLMSTLYSETNRQILEWCVGCIIAGDVDKIQKLLVLYGEPGTGKSTFLEIARQLFEWLCTNFSVRDVVNRNNSFPLESFKDNPAIAIDNDGDLSGITDNTMLNKLISHEWVEMNLKNKSKYSMKPISFLMVATNKPVKITDSKSGMLRRILDVVPTGDKVSRKEYDNIMNNKIKFELGAIADHCLKVYESMGPSYYDSYIPLSMMAETNDFYNFMESNMDEYYETEYITQAKIWNDYTSYCLLFDVKHKLSYREIGSELRNYFKNFDDRKVVNGERLRKVYSGFRKEKFMVMTELEQRGMGEEPLPPWLVFDKHNSLFDGMAADYPAQLATEDEKPKSAWSNVTTKLQDIDTSKLHYVRVPKNHIVIDFDIKDGKEKSFDKNLEAASKFPPTYAELSKSEAGIHLHYIYDGDVSKLSSVYGDNIEVKVFNGKSSLRRKLTRCNDKQIATISSGLPLKEVKPMVDDFVCKTDKELLNRIAYILKTGKPHGHHKPNIDFINKLLDSAYESGLIYDVGCLYDAVFSYAMASHNQRDVCCKIVANMKFSSKKGVEDNRAFGPEKPIVFFDVEVFPNLFIICWKYLGAKGPCTRMINPSPESVKALWNNNRLVGFNNRRYDNHILYAWSTGMNNKELYEVSQKLIAGEKTNAFFRNAYTLSYTDIFDYSSKKQSLKKWEIELGSHHQELGMKWNEPVPEDKWHLVAEYCDNDVFATEAVWNATQADFKAREIISALSGLTVNDTNNSHTARIVFGNNRHPQSQFVYTDLSIEFPGYVHENGRSYYNDEFIGEGGFVWQVPGMYNNVWVFDVASMHPHTIKYLNMFGDEYTAKYFSLVEARIAIKHGDFDAVGKMFDGKLTPFLTDKDTAKQLSNALKIVINSVYGLTSAKFDNEFRDPRNVDNICAKRGELFMITLRDNLLAMGAEVVHIKTDSIKVVDPSEEVKNYIYEYGKSHGYTFEIEDIYERFCLVNGSTYIAKHAEGTYDKEKNPSGWEAKAAQFAQPYVFKTLFSKEEIKFEDMCETKSVKTAISLDMNENLPEGEHQYEFIGKVGLFCPIISGSGGGLLVAERDDKKTGGIKYDAVTGTKGYRWLEAETVRERHLEDKIDRSYYISQVDAAKDEISKYGDFEMFVAQ